MDSTPDTSSGFGRGALLLAGSNAVYVLSAYATTTLLARVLAPERFGAFGVVMSWITILTAVLVKGLSTSIARQMATAGSGAATAWRAGRWLGIVLGATLGAVGVAASPLLAPLVGAGAYAEQLAIGSLGALTFGVNAVLLAWPIGQRRYGRQALAQVAYAFARLVIVLGGGIAWGLGGAVAGYVLAPLVSSIVLIMRAPRSTSAHRWRSERRALLRMIGPVSIVSVAISAYFVVDVFALSRALGAHAAGVYVALGTLGHVPFFLLQATSVAMVPAIAAARSHDARRAAIRRTITDTIALLAGPTLLLVTAGDQAGAIIFGDAYRANGLIVAPVALATACVTILAGLVAIDVALDRMRGAVIIVSTGCAGVWIAATAGAQVADAAPVSAAAWCVAGAAAATLLLMSVRVTHRIGSIVDVRRASSAVALGAITALPPLLVPGSRTAVTFVAAACGVAWLVLVLRLRLVDARRASPDPQDAAASSGV